jgi:hypothetical protein
MRARDAGPMTNAQAWWLIVEVGVIAVVALLTFLMRR